MSIFYTLISGTSRQIWKALDNPILEKGRQGYEIKLR